MKKLLLLILAIAALLYPFAVHFSLNYIEPRYLAIISLIIAIARWKFFPNISEVANALTPMLIIILSTLVLASIFNNEIFFKITPAIVQIGLAGYFLYTIKNPPTIPEHFARKDFPQLPENAIQYCRSVTIVWSIFFILNSLISLYTAFWCSRGIWSIYNGAINYCLIALVAIIEFCYRKKIEPQFAKAHKELLEAQGLS